MRVWLPLPNPPARSSPFPANAPNPPPPLLPRPHRGPRPGPPEGGWRAVRARPRRRTTSRRPARRRRATRSPGSRL
ncbi:hypothetical protein DYH09_00240 [bacterium CPR1]|nr:hypothetical protein [bacterium CPR1]